jgi:hypothetical protein
MTNTRTPGKLVAEWDNKNRWQHGLGIVNYEAADQDAMPYILLGCDQVFGKVKQLKQEIDRGSRKKDESNLRLAMDYAAEIYWLMSQAWPYRRGSSSIADLSTKVIFDWLGIEVPLFKADVYPNINALLSPAEKFKADYPSFFQGAFRWLEQPHAP